MRRVTTPKSLLGRVVPVESYGLRHAQCDACGASHVLGTPCPRCAEFEAENGRQTALACGGCGAGFLVSPRLTVDPVVVDGAARAFCACCHAYLGDHLRSSNLARRLGYDIEGHAINIWFPSLTPTEKRRHRDPRTQAHLRNVLRVNASRLKIQRPEPLFLAT